MLTRTVPLARLLLCLLPCAAVSAYSPLNHWTLRAGASVNRVRFCGGQFVAVGNGGLLLTSTNGANWLVQTSGTSSALYGVAHNGTSYLAVGDNVMLGSVDARHWTNVVLTNQLGHLRDVAVSGSQFLAVGQRYFGTAPNVLVRATLPSPVDGTYTWQSVLVSNTVPCDAGFPELPASFAAVTRVGATWIAVGEICTGIWTSANGTSWTYRTGTARNSAKAEHFQGVASGNGVVVSVGMEGPPFVGVSPFATANWTNHLVNTNAGQFDPLNHFVGYDIAFGDGRFVVPHGTTGQTLETTNGRDWLVHAGTNAATSIAYGAGTFVKAGTGGIYQSDSVAGKLAVRRVSLTGPVEITVNIESNRAFAVESATELPAWSELWRGTNFGTNVQYLDWSVTNGPKRLYRTVTP